MADVTLGKPIKNLTVILSAGGVGFTDTYTHTAPINPSTAVELTFNVVDGDDIVWPANLSGSNAVFTATDEEVQAVLDSGATRARLTFTLAGAKSLLAAGSVSIQGA